MREIIPIDIMISFSHAVPVKNIVASIILFHSEFFLQFFSVSETIEVLSSIENILLLTNIVLLIRIVDF